MRESVEPRQPSAQERIPPTDEGMKAATEVIQLKSGEEVGLQKEAIVRVGAEDFAAAGLAGIQQHDKLLVEFPGADKPLLFEAAGVGPEGGWKPENEHDKKMAGESSLRFACLWVYPLNEAGARQGGAVFIRPQNFNLLKKMQ